MPVVLAAEAWPAWLAEEPADPRELKALLAPYPSGGVTCWPVITRVRTVKNNDPSLIGAAHDIVVHREQEPSTRRSVPTKTDGQECSWRRTILS
jgi:hypothetical protein